MRIAVWDIPAADLIARALEATGEATVRRADPRACARLLKAGDVDAALLPTLSVLIDADAYHVLPGVALSAWTYPYARIVLRQALNVSPEQVAFNPAHAQETLLTQIVLKEHYGED